MTAAESIEPDSLCCMTPFLGSTIEDAVFTPPGDGMFDVVPEVVSRFEGQVWLISKCGPRVQEKTRRSKPCRHSCPTSICMDLRVRDTPQTRLIVVETWRDLERSIP